MTESIRSPIRLLAVALALGACADLLFYNRLPGVSLPLFALLCAGSLLCVARLEGVLPARRNAWLVTPLIFFAFMVFVRASFALTFLNLIACLTIAGLWVYFFSLGKLPGLDWFDYPLALLRVLLYTLYLPPLLAAGVVGGLGTGRKAWAVLRGGLLATPLLCIFAVLFSFADPIFARYAVPFNWDIDLGSVIFQTLFILFVAWFSAGSLAYAMLRRQNGGVREPGAASPGVGPIQSPGAPLSLRLGFAEAATVLALLNALFLGFVLVQALYLFGGQANVSAQGYTYAEYARRGFFELIAVALLTLGVVWALDRLTERPKRKQRIAFLGLGLAMVGMVMVILTSASLRLSLYESAYGYTNLRLFSHVFIVWLAGVFVLFVIALCMARPRQFIFGALLAIPIYLAAMNLVNPDRLIAQWNIQRYADTGQLDGEYLSSLSDDAVPVVLGILDMEEELEAQEAVGVAFRERLRYLESRVAQDGWPAYHLARRDALTALRARRDILETFPADEGSRSKERLPDDFD